MKAPPTCAGVQVFVNDTELTEAPRQQGRGFQLGRRTRQYWWSRGFRLMYAPDFEANNNPADSYYIHGGGPTFGLNITDPRSRATTLRLKHAQTDADSPRAAC